MASFAEYDAKKRIEDANKKELGQLLNPNQNRYIPPVKAGVTFNGKEGEITTQFIKRPPENASWDWLLREKGFDPSKYRLIEPVGYTTREFVTDNGVEELASYKLRVVSKFNNGSGIDIEDLVKSIRGTKIPRAVFKKSKGSFILCVADPQAGKNEGNGLGSPALKKRWISTLKGVVERIEFLRRGGLQLDTLGIFFMGDLVENVAGYYAMQGFSVDLDLRGQKSLIAELSLLTFQTLAPMFKEVIVACVPGNHGEAARVDGKATTTFGDNHDVAVIEDLERVIRLSGINNMRFIIPKNELSICVEVGGTVFGLSHGHIQRRGTLIEKKMYEWWKSQAFSHHDVEVAQVLITAHYHHQQLREYSEGRKWFQCPSMDESSFWFEASTGENSAPGFLTMVTNNKKVYLADVIHPDGSTLVLNPETTEVIGKKTPKKKEVELSL